MARLIWNLLRGLMAGMLAGAATVLLAYPVGAVAILVKLRDFFATLLASVTVLPLMLLFVVFPISLIVGGITGFALAIISDLKERTYFVALGAIFSFVLAEVLLSIVAPLVFNSEPGDFVSIIKNPFLSGCYGLTLGTL